MSFKFYITLISIGSLVLVSCKQKNSSINSVKKSVDLDSVVGIPLLSCQDFKINKDSIIDDLLKKENIPDYHQKVFKAKKIIHTYDSIKLSIIDSFLIINSNHHAFYFMVFTYSMNGSDGFYSEAIGLTALDYFKSNTLLFFELSSFSYPTEFTDNDYDNWASYIKSELEISNESNYKNEINALCNYIDKQISKSNKYDSIVLKFKHRLQLH